MERFKSWLVTYPDGKEATLYCGKGFVHETKGQVCCGQKGDLAQRIRKCLQAESLRFDMIHQGSGPALST